MRRNAYSSTHGVRLPLDDGHHLRAHPVHGHDSLLDAVALPQRRRRPHPALDHLEAGADSGDEKHTGLGADFWGAVWAIILADISTGFDKMMPVARAAHGSALLVVLGLAISMPILIWGSTWVARLMNSYPSSYS
ncbi:MAG: hypothetical protein AB1446_02915 [Bacillota bacterium]